MKSAYILSISFVFTLTSLCAQEVQKMPLTVSLFTVATQLPGGKILPIHPGIEAGIEFRLNRSPKHVWFQSAKLGVYHHRLSQTGIMLYSENGYRPALFKRLSADIRLGAGYLLAISDLQNFTLKDGIYQEKTTVARSQFMASTFLGFAWKLNSDLNSPGIFAGMSCFFQMPFIKSYVPILPNTAWHAGVSVPVFEKRKKII